MQVQCKGKTRTGRRCQRLVTDGSEYCWQHHLEQEREPKGLSASPNTAERDKQGQRRKRRIDLSKPLWFLLGALFEALIGDLVEYTKERLGLEHVLPPVPKSSSTSEAVPPDPPTPTSTATVVPAPTPSPTPTATAVASSTEAAQRAEEGTPSIDERNVGLLNRIGRELRGFIKSEDVRIPISMIAAKEILERQEGGYKSSLVDPQICSQSIQARKVGGGTIMTTTMSRVLISLLTDLLI